MQARAIKPVGTPVALPGPTTDLTKAKADLDQFGYCLVANALPAPQCAKLRESVVEIARAELQRGLAFEDGGPDQQWGAFKDAHGSIRRDAFRAANGGVNQRVWMLANKGREFTELLENETARELVGHVLGEEYLLSSHTANIAKPGSVPMNLHTDQWWMPAPTRTGRSPLPVGSMTRTRFDIDENAPADRSPPMISPAAVCNVIWMLNDFTEANGGTRIVPGSHLSGRHPDGELDADVETVAAAGPAGTALFTDGRVWHGTGANIGNTPRYGLITTFCGPQFRPQENYTVGLDEAVLRKVSPRVRALLGFKVWWAYGRTGDPTDEFITRPGSAS
ncbi:MAG: phytanoyl-CoA dioxygenase family protein [Gammaproteobacteria bacterium]